MACPAWCDRLCRRHCHPHHCGCRVARDGYDAWAAQGLQRARRLLARAAQSRDGSHWRRPSLVWLVWVRWLRPCYRRTGVEHVFATHIAAASSATAWVVLDCFQVAARPLLASMERSPALRASLLHQASSLQRRRNCRSTLWSWCVRRRAVLQGEPSHRRCLDVSSVHGVTGVVGSPLAGVTPSSVNRIAQTDSCTATARSIAPPDD